MMACMIAARGAMNNVVAYQLLSSELEGYRGLPYNDLVALIGQTHSSRKLATDGMEYDIDIAVWWSNEGPGKILVDGMIGPVDCGSPLGRLDDNLIVSPPDNSGT